MPDRELAELLDRFIVGHWFYKDRAELFLDALGAAGYRILSPGEGRRFLFRGRVGTVHDVKPGGWYLLIPIDEEG